MNIKIVRKELNIFMEGSENRIRSQRQIKGSVTKINEV